MKRPLLSAFLAVVLAAIATAAPAGAADDPVRNIQFKGTSGVSFWTTCPWLYDSSYPAEDVAMCTNTSIFITEDAYREDGTPYAGSYALFTEVHYADVDGELVPVRIREGYGSAEDWRVERDLESGSARIVVPVRDCIPGLRQLPGTDICVPGEATVEASWQAAGPLIRTTGAGAFKAGDSLNVYHINSIRRETTASGVVDGVETGTHIVSMLFSTSGGSISMCRESVCLESQ